MKKLLFFCCLLTIWACDNDTKPSVETQTPQAQANNQIQPIEDAGAKEAPIPGTTITQRELDNLKPNMNEPAPDFVLKGVNFQPELNKTMVAKGKKIYTDKKCSECHALTVSGGSASSFANMFSRHEPVWVMNMTRNVKVEVDSKMNNCPTRTEAGKLSFMQSRDFLELVRSLNE